MKLAEMCPADFLAGLRATEGLVGTPTDAYALRIFRQELRRRLDVAYEAERGKATETPIRSSGGDILFGWIDRCLARGGDSIL